MILKGEEGLEFYWFFIRYLPDKELICSFALFSSISSNLAFLVVSLSSFASCCVVSWKGAENRLSIFAC